MSDGGHGQSEVTSTLKLGVIPENLAERLALWIGIPPPGIIESWLGIMAARAVMAATRLNIFEAVAACALTAQEVAKKCATHPRATEQLLNALVGVGCLRTKGERYLLPRNMRDWVLADGKYSFRDQILLHYLEWRWCEHCEDYVRTGEPLRVHQTMTDVEWGIYQRGMRAGIAFPANWVARNLRLPKTARAMLDIGGAHGFFSVALCRRHPQLRSTILELPQAIKHAAPLLAKEDLGDRIDYQEGDVLMTDLGAGRYDLVFLAAVVHHFDDATNRQLVKRVAQALRPGGIIAMWEPLRHDRAGKTRQLGGLMDLFFGLFSEAGTWSAAEIAGWCEDAGLQPRKPKRMWFGPDMALHIGRKLA
jgi:2-polyprenyl-3-methyl-5-hydroxy-6-metoxy-1,4-benzoquinol methylase